MPVRRVNLITDEIYHIINRSIDSIQIFKQSPEYQVFLEAAFYYQNVNFPCKYSEFRRREIKKRNEILDNLKKENNLRVEIICYCLMPNHYHFLLKQRQDGGISNFIMSLCGSYSHYFNIKYKRKGPLFEDRFRAVEIETDEQLLHVNRYIHLNPYSADLVKNKNELINYPFSSFPEYLNESDSFCQKEIITENFKDVHSYKEFVLNQRDYQKTLQRIRKHEPGSC
jgi:putative transposase